MLILESLVGLHRSVQLQLLQYYWSHYFMYKNGHLFWVFILEGLVGLHRSVQLQLLQHDWHYYFMANRWENSGNSDILYFLGSKITADDDFSHEVMGLDAMILVF